MQYIITTVDPLKNSGGNKAKKDIEHFASELVHTGYFHVPVYPTKIGKFFKTELVVKKLVNEHPAQRYILQYPVVSPFVCRQIVHTIRKKTNAKLDLIVHDIPSIQFGGDRVHDELALLNNMDALIVHNDVMKNWLLDHNVTTKIISLGIFDYDNPQPMQGQHPYQPTVCFPGNLAKSTFLTKLNIHHKLDIFGPNKFENYPDCIKYKGQYTPEDLPKHLSESFGLVWDGDSVKTCGGTFGEYLRFNNPHKASLYLSCGIPVIIWEKAALAKFVVNNGVGVTIDNLNNLDELLSNMSDNDYQIMKVRTQELGMKLRRGYYIKNALVSLMTEE